jgi:hypothetical protein
MLAPDDVMLGRIGADSLMVDGRDWQAFPKSTPQAGCQHFAETGHNLCGDSLALWRRMGSAALPVFGMPLSDTQVEHIGGQERMVQWFERARFEMHPEMAPGGRVLLGLLGSSLRQRTSDKIANAMSAAPMSLAAMRP